MSQDALNIPLVRFLATLEIVYREGVHLGYSRKSLFSMDIDAEWASRLDSRPEEAERLEAFVSRFGRMQDTISDKLLPRWLQAMAERPGSLIETLQRAERLGIVEDASRWVLMRQLRNKLVHEYLTDPADFAESLNLAHGFVPELFETYNRLRRYTEERMGVEKDRLQPLLTE